MELTNEEIEREALKQMRIVEHGGFEGTLANISIIAIACAMVVVVVAKIMVSM